MPTFKSTCHVLTEEDLRNHKHLKTRNYKPLDFIVVIVGNKNRNEIEPHSGYSAMGLFEFDR